MSSFGAKYFGTANEGEKKHVFFRKNSSNSIHTYADTKVYHSFIDYSVHRTTDVDVIFATTTSASIIVVVVFEQALFNT